MKNKIFVYAAFYMMVLFIVMLGYANYNSSVKENIKLDITKKLAVSSNELASIQLSDDAEYPAPIIKLQKALAVAIQDNSNDMAASGLQLNAKQPSESTSIKDIDELDEKLNNLKALTGNN